MNRALLLVLACLAACEDDKDDRECFEHYSLGELCPVEGYPDCWEREDHTEVCLQPDEYDPPSEPGACWDLYFCYQDCADAWHLVENNCHTENDVCTDAESDLDACYRDCGWTGDDAQPGHDDAVALLDTCETFGLNSAECHDGSAACMRPD